MFVGLSTVFAGGSGVDWVSDAVEFAFASWCFAYCLCWIAGGVCGYDSDIGFGICGVWWFEFVLGVWLFCGFGVWCFPICAFGFVVVYALLLCRFDRFAFLDLVCGFCL